MLSLSIVNLAPRNVVYSFGVSVARTAFVEGPPFSQRKSAMLDPEAKAQRTGK